MQGLRFERATKRLEKNIAISAVPAFLCACVLFSDFSYAKADDEYSQNKKGILASPCLAIVEFQQQRALKKNHPVYSPRVFLVANRKSTVSEKVHPSYRKTEIASSVQLERIYKHSLLFLKTLSGESRVFAKSIEYFV